MCDLLFFQLLFGFFEKLFSFHLLHFFLKQVHLFLFWEIKQSLIFCCSSQILADLLDIRFILFQSFNSTCILVRILSTFNSLLDFLHLLPLAHAINLIILLYG